MYILLEMAKLRAVPLCLPNNCRWDEKTGEYSKNAEERKTLYVVDAALQKLQSIKDPVCTVSIVGPCRKGKSYLLSKAFDQGEVFPLGHQLDPETMGIWMWIVPKKFKVLFEIFLRLSFLFFSFSLSKQLMKLFTMFY